MRPRILVTGCSGQVGTGIAEANRGRFELAMPERSALDLSGTIRLDGEFAAIINCGAYTAVDKAETERDLAFAINADAAGQLARLAAERGIPMLHVSTDYVFDGSKDAPYVETDAVAPLGAYGASKEAGERAVRESGCRHVILRTAWVVSPWGHNFVKTMLRLGSERDELRVVGDQIGCPTSAADIAETLLAILERMLADASAPGGTYHFVNAGEASWFELASFVLADKPVKVTRITTADYPTPAKRPANSRLSTAKLHADYGITPRPWQAAVADVLAALLADQRQ